jgi:hypothetical protein
MSTHIERRVDLLAKRLKLRTRKDGTPLPGFEQNVASIKAELAELSAKEY